MNAVGSSCSVPDVCQGAVQSGISGVGAREGSSLSAGGWRLPGASVSGGPLSGTVSSKGSKMRGSASDDMVPSVASSGDSWTAVSAASVRDQTRVETDDGWRDFSTHTLLVSDKRELTVVSAEASLWV